MEWRLQACSHLENGFQWGYGLIGANRWANIDAVSSFGSTGQRNTLSKDFEEDDDDRYSFGSLSVSWNVD
jgi:hypothetical protein